MSVQSSSLSCQRRNSIDDFPVGRPVIMKHADVPDLALSVHGLSSRDDLGGSAFLVTKPGDSSDAGASSSGEGSIFSAREVTRFTKRDFAACPECVVSIAEYATFEIIDSKSVRPDLRRYSFTVIRIDDERFKVTARDGGALCSSGT